MLAWGVDRLATTSGRGRKALTCGPTFLTPTRVSARAALRNISQILKFIRRREEGVSMEIHGFGFGLALSANP